LFTAIDNSASVVTPIASKSTSPLLRPAPAEPKTPTQLAKAAMTDAHGRLDRAASNMLEMLQAMPAYESLINGILLDWCRGHCEKVMRSERHITLRRSTPAAAVPTGMKASEMKRRAEIRSEKSWMLFTLKGGVRLGDADRATVAASQQHYLAQSATMGLRARWLAGVLERLPDGKKVRHVLTNDDLAALYAAAEASS